MKVSREKKAEADRLGRGKIAGANEKIKRKVGCEGDKGNRVTFIYVWVGGRYNY